MVVSFRSWDTESYAHLSGTKKLKVSPVLKDVSCSTRTLSSLPDSSTSAPDWWLGNAPRAMKPEAILASRGRVMVRSVPFLPIVDPGAKLPPMTRPAAQKYADV